MLSESDRELLKLAAKAAGIIPDTSQTNGGPSRNDGFDIAGNLVLDWHNCKVWNPLTDDGDALRLAVGLNLFNGAEFYHFRSLERFGRQDEDDLAATRRAIVRAAAEIGRQDDH